MQHRPEHSIFFLLQAVCIFTWAYAGCCAQVEGDCGDEARWHAAVTQQAKGSWVQLPLRLRPAVRLWPCLRGGACASALTTMAHASARARLSLALGPALSR